MNDKINTSKDIDGIVNPIIELKLTSTDLKLIASRLLEEAAIIDEEIEYKKRKGNNNA